MTDMPSEIWVEPISDNRVVAWVECSKQTKKRCAVYRRADLVPSVSPEQPSISVAMRALWDAGYKIHGEFGWVVDRRPETDALLGGGGE